MSDTQTQKPVEAGGYESYYLKVNPPTDENYRSKAKGYRRKFAKLLDDASPKTILDVGCATGMLSKYLVDRGHEVVGVDLNAELVDVAREHVDAEFHAADAVDFARSCNRRFDMIFLLDILEHVPKDRVVDLLSALKGLLNPGGFVLLRTPNMNAIHVVGMFYVDWTHITPFTERSLMHVARLAGYDRTEFVPQFGMQNFKGKVRAALSHCLGKYLVWLRGGHRVKIFHRNLIAKLYA